MLNYTNDKNLKCNNKKKLAGILFCILLTMGIITQSIFAFFSDVVTGDENITAGTLDMVVDSSNFYINGSATPATSAELANINPGDYVTAEITVSNVGSKSAWLLMELTLSGSSGADLDTVFDAYEGIGTGGGMLTGTVDTNTVTFASAGDTIMDGTYETETGSVGTSLTLIYTIYFDTAADNAWQNATIGLGYTIRALQYRNNPTPNWADAVALATAT